MYDWEDDEYGYWENWGGYCSPAATAATKKKYGYMENAVLECPDINEFRRCPKNV